MEEQDRLDRRTIMVEKASQFLGITTSRKASPNSRTTRTSRRAQTLLQARHSPDVVNTTMGSVARMVMEHQAGLHLWHQVQDVDSLGEERTRGRNKTSQKASLEEGFVLTDS